VNLVAALEVAGAVPVGWACALAARRLAGTAAPTIAAMIAVQACVALSAVLLAPPPAVPALLLAGWGLGLLGVVDLLALRLPDIVTLPLGVAGLILGPGLVASPLSEHIIGAAAGYLVLALIGWIYARLRGRDGLGLGDAKLLAVAGAWLGWKPLPSVVVLACAGGLAWAALKLLRRGQDGLSEPIAFGLPLSGAIWASLLLAVAGAAS
jgi:leader peptidase (prepilin peptidase)/N-methyltransferase